MNFCVFVFCMRMCWCGGMRVHVCHVYLCMLQIHARKDFWSMMLLYLCIHACMCVSVCVCVCVCVCIYIYIYIYIHTHTNKLIKLILFSHSSKGSVQTRIHTHTHTAWLCHLPQGPRPAWSHRRARTVRFWLVRKEQTMNKMSARGHGLHAHFNRTCGCS
jgi:hypothetical protein